MKPAFTTATTNTTFRIFTNLTAFDHAEAACNSVGGHLATYQTPGEQSEVEKYLIDQVSWAAVDRTKPATACTSVCGSGCTQGTCRAGTQATRRPLCTAIQPATSSSKQHSPCLSPFLPQGYLIPGYEPHKQYWFGLNTTEPGTNRYNWTWVDFSESPSELSYMAWGTGMPDNLETKEACAGPSYELAGGDPRVWMWDDLQCQQKHPAVCRITRESWCLSAWGVWAVGSAQ